MSRLVASWSKDRSRHVGAVIVDARNVAVSMGWNGFPRNIRDDIDERHDRPDKYLWSEHAERNALFNAAASGNSTLGCRIYQSMYPCAHCARGIIQAGICEVVTVEPNWDDITYSDEFKVTQKMLREAKVRVRFVAGETPARIDHPLKRGKPFWRRAVDRILDRIM
jgi:dCMP deaminase